MECFFNFAFSLLALELIFNSCHLTGGELLKISLLIAAHFIQVIKFFLT